jgi:predicted nucleotidyltransferase
MVSWRTSTCGHKESFVSRYLSTFPKRFHAAYQAIQRLESYDRYRGAFIFGSLARQEATAHSDCDVQIIIDEDNPCTNVREAVITKEQIRMAKSAKDIQWY